MLKKQKYEYGLAPTPIIERLTTTAFQNVLNDPSYRIRYLLQHLQDFVIFINDLADVFLIPSSGEASRQFGHAICKFFCVYRPYKESISKEMNNDDLNLHSMTKLSGWLRY